MSERVHRSMMNIKVGMIFYILSLFLAFFSRKVFLDCLGAEFIGITGMLNNIMGYLSVAILEHVDNKLYILRFNNRKLEKRESLYAHFQHRGFMKDKVTDYSHFLVTPNAIIDYPKHFTMLKLRYYSRKRNLMTKYYQWKDRIIWKIEKGYIK